jgi:hypothetical protein
MPQHLFCAPLCTNVLHMSADPELPLRNPQPLALTWHTHTAGAAVWMHNRPCFLSGGPKPEQSETITFPIPTYSDPPDTPCQYLPASSTLSPSAGSILDPLWHPTLGSV